ncbi:porphobilinogen synthase [Parabacteroides sp. Marseille-P3160]|uniref:porphobilinogen synthase n=1 Tax=Parabacteroides sp. Marseille-P3160 TaxID=1917887 RepID=UPI0009BA06BB|nr:porphobilinogen synthase [Parabacteroides sp. Marseille-P3160]
MKRFRPYRATQEIRDQYADIHLSVADFIYPYFVVEGTGVKEEIPSMKGIYRFSVDLLLEDIRELLSVGVNKILLFGVIPAEEKDEKGSAGFAADNIVSRAVRAIKKSFPEVIVFTDVCLCEYTSHGHCGLLHNHDVDNDSTLPLLAEMAYQHAVAGADFVAPSAMMDGQVEAIRKRLDKEKLSTKILAYSAKYASAFYGPFRDAAGSAPSFGDRKAYQMDFRTKDQGLEEIAADIEEGADWIMVKPALAYLDIIQRASVRFPDYPLVSYQVSGEYAMLKTGAQAGFFDEDRIFFESLTSIKRAGAQYIITYYAKEFGKKTSK